MHRFPDIPPPTARRRLNVFSPLLLSIALILLIVSCDTGADPPPGDEITEIPFLDSYIPSDRYAELLSNRWSDEEAGIEIFFGKRRLRGSVEPQGAGSRFHSRWSFKLELREGTYLNDLQVSNLSAQTFDDSRLRTVLASTVFGELGFPTFDFHPVFLRINGRNLGLYLQIERFEQRWFERRGIPVHELIKAGFGARFTYDSGNHLEKYFEKEIPDSDNLNNFGDFIHALDRATPETLFDQVSPHLDIPQYLRYHAAASVLNHVDGFTNNMLFYRSEPRAPYTVIPWDFDKVMYEANDVGLIGGNDIIRKLLQNDSCVSMYKRELQRIVDNILLPARLFPVLDAFASRIATAHALDPDLGLSGIDLSVESERLKMDIIRRRAFVRTNIDSITRFPR